MSTFSLSQLVRAALVAIAVFGVTTGHTATLDPDRSTVLITGSNRGIGLAFVTHYLEAGWNVLATTRSPDRATELHALAAANEHLIIEALDVTDARRIAELAGEYAGTPIDLLINNAGIYGGDEGQTLGSLDSEAFHNVMAINVLAPLKMIEAFSDNVAASRQKKIVAITSGAGSVTGERVSTGGAFYSISKTGLNMAMRKASAELADRDIIVALIAPGLVLTDMLRTNRPSLASRANSPAESVAGMAAVIASLDETYDGRPLNYNGSTLPW